MAVIGQIARHLHEAAYDVYLAGDANMAQALAAHLPFREMSELKLESGDRWIVPEGWPAFLAPGLKAGAVCAVYVQNWAFLLGILPENVSWASLPVKMFSVSRPVALFVKETTGLSGPVVRPAINPRIFYPAPGADRIYHKEEKIRIAWMPRKNRHLARQIRDIFEAMLGQSHVVLPDWIAIDNMSPAEVAEAMRSCQIFLASGFPEGCPLPPLEAMACGCIPVGFTGMGGWEYMRQASPDAWKPFFELPSVAWRGNGFYVSDGDIWGVALALKTAYASLHSDLCLPIREAAFETARDFSPEKQKEEVLGLWADHQFWNAAGFSR